MTRRLAAPDQVFRWKDSVKIRYRDEEWELEGRRTVRQAIEEVGLSSETLLAVRDGKVVADNVMLEADDEIRLLAVISGGSADHLEKAAADTLQHPVRETHSQRGLHDRDI